MKEIILASRSPRRSELLKKHGVSFRILVSEAEEVKDGALPIDIAKSNAFLKANAVFKDIKENNIIVLGADTVVALDDKIFGKPKDKQDAFNMLSSLSGKEHQVITGVSILKREDNKETVLTLAEVTFVKFKELKKEEIDEYLLLSEAYDKAGSYALQGVAKKFVEYIKGDYENVVGLPVEKILKYLY